MADATLYGRVQDKMVFCDPLSNVGCRWFRPHLARTAQVADRFVDEDK
jgi:hypothetical protein